MKKFIIKISILAVLILIIAAVLVAIDYYVVGSQFKLNYQASAVDKIQRLLEIDKPKIILVGNSNLAFGMDSEMLEESLGMPVVNLGLHGNLGNAYHEQMAKIGIKKDDIVVVCHTSFYDNDELTDCELAWVTYDYNSLLLPIIRTKDYEGMLRAYPRYLFRSYMLWATRSGNKDSGDCYSREAFNKYGDIVFKPAKYQMNAEDFFATVNVRVPGINDICVDRLNELNKYCEARGAHLVVAGYPIAYGKYSSFTADDFVRFKNELDARLDCDVISDYQDYFFPYDYFYNTEFHLNEEGTRARTRNLISDIEKWKIRTAKISDLGE